MNYSASFISSKQEVSSSVEGKSIASPLTPSYNTALMHHSSIFDTKNTTTTRTECRNGTITLPFSERDAQQRVKEDTDTTSPAVCHLSITKVKSFPSSPDDVTDNFSSSISSDSHLQEAVTARKKSSVNKFSSISYLNDSSRDKNIHYRYLSDDSTTMKPERNDCVGASRENAKSKKRSHSEQQDSNIAVGKKQNQKTKDSYSSTKSRASQCAIFFSEQRCGDPTSTLQCADQPLEKDAHYPLLQPSPQQIGSNCPCSSKLSPSSQPCSYPLNALFLSKEVPDETKEKESLKITSQAAKKKEKEHNVENNTLGKMDKIRRGDLSGGKNSELTKNEKTSALFRISEKKKKEATMQAKYDNPKACGSSLMAWKKEKMDRQTWNEITPSFSLLPRRQLCTPPGLHLKSATRTAKSADLILPAEAAASTNSFPIFSSGDCGTSSLQKNRRGPSTWEDARREQRNIYDWEQHPSRVHAPRKCLPLQNDSSPFPYLKRIPFRKPGLKLLNLEPSNLALDSPFLANLESTSAGSSASSVTDDALCGAKKTRAHRKMLGDHYCALVDSRTPSQDFLENIGRIQVTSPLLTRHLVEDHLSTVSKLDLIEEYLLSFQDKGRRSKGFPTMNPHHRHSQPHCHAERNAPLMKLHFSNTTLSTKA